MAAIFLCVQAGWDWWSFRQQEQRALALYNADHPNQQVTELDSLLRVPGTLLSSPPGARVTSAGGAPPGRCPLAVVPGQSYELALPGWRARVVAPADRSLLVRLQPDGPPWLRWPLSFLSGLCALAAIALWLREERRLRLAEERAGVFPGSWIGPYELGERLGQGAMAEVFRARHRRTGEPRAVKVLTEVASQDPELRQRFLREVGLCSQTLSHPNIVGYYEQGEQYGRLWTAMDLVEGGCLAERLGSGLPPGEIVPALIQIVRALEYAHGRQVFHRDLKPENVLVQGSTLRVADFGLARGGQYPRITLTGTTLGTPAYMPPEQVGGSLPADGRGDLYSVGCILYEMMTGRTPFQGEALEVIVAQLSQSPPAPSSLRAGLHPELEAIALRLLQKSPEDRYSISELLAALTSLKL